MAQLSLLLVLQLDIKYFLLNFFFVSLLEPGDVSRSLFRLIDLLPRLHFLLLEESNSICQQLRVPLDILSSLLDVRKTLYLLIVSLL